MFLRSTGKDNMQRVTHSRASIALVGFCLAAAVAPGALAQGSAGGSIGNDDKAVSGSRQERAVERERPPRRQAEARRPAPRRSDGGGGGTSFDGAWVVNAIGVTCQGSSSNAVVVTSGRIIGNNVTSGRVSASGAVYATGGSNGLTNVTTGRLSGRSGSGSFRQSDGCVGRWTATKQ
jgi:hypothetical protein